jgi:hypothetical protein
VKAIARGTKVERGKKLLPFWAPPSAGMKSQALNTNESYNKKVNQLSKSTKKDKVENVSRKINCWDNDEFFDHKLKFMMTFSDAKECTFIPNVGNKISDAPKKNNFDTKSDIYQYGKFKRSLNCYKAGDYMQAYKHLVESFNIAEIKASFSHNTYDHQKFLKKTIFTTENTKPEREWVKPLGSINEGNRMFLERVHQLIKAIEYTEVELQQKQKAIKTMLDSYNLPGSGTNGMTEINFIKSNNNMNNQSRLSQTGESKLDLSRLDKRNPDHVKSLMCPLGDKCPGDIRPKWPISNLKTIEKLGKNCDLAHHTFELKFSAEVEAKKKILQTMLVKASEDYFAKKKDWNPAGNKLGGCHGRLSFCSCSSCHMRRDVEDKLRKYQAKAHRKYFLLTQKESFKKKYIPPTEHDLKEKLGLFRKACILFKSQRYNDAYGNVVKAIKLIQKEKEKSQVEQKTLEDFWKKKLDIPLELQVTPEMIYEENNEEAGGNDTTSRTGMSTAMGGTIKAKYKLYAEKTGLIGDGKLDVNQFLNLQIEEIYKKIEKAIGSTQSDIDFMKKKIGVLQGDEEEDLQPRFTYEPRAKFEFKGNKCPRCWHPEDRDAVHDHSVDKTEETTMDKSQAMDDTLKSKYSPKPKFQKTEMCKNNHKKGYKYRVRCDDEDCVKAHAPIELDLVKPEKKANNLTSVLKTTQKKMEECKPPRAWKPTSAQDAVQKIDDYDKNREIKKFLRLQNNTNADKKDLEHTRSKLFKTGEYTAEIYDMDADTLGKLPYQRSPSPKKY